MWVEDKWQAFICLSYKYVGFICCVYIFILLYVYIHVLQLCAAPFTFHLAFNQKIHSRMLIHCRGCSLVARCNSFHCFILFHIIFTPALFVASTNQQIGLDTF